MAHPSNTAPLTELTSFSAALLPSPPLHSAAADRLTRLLSLSVPCPALCLFVCLCPSPPSSLLACFAGLSRLSVPLSLSVCLCACLFALLLCAVVVVCGGQLALGSSHIPTVSYRLLTCVEPPLLLQHCLPLPTVELLLSCLPTVRASCMVQWSLCGALVEWKSKVLLV